MTKDYSFIDHTADIGVSVEGKDYKEIFLKTAKAMFDVMAKPKEILKKTKKTRLTVELKAADINELLFDWLNELVSLSDARNLIFTDFENFELKNNYLKTVIYGFARENFIFEREIKAVTYHHLKIEKINGSYKVQVIFDV